MKLLVLFCSLIMCVTSCKRGPEDPGFSFTSRKSRLVGEWKVLSVTALSGGTSSTANETEIVYTAPDSSTLTIPYTWTMTFDREGTYVSLLTEDYPEDTVAVRQAFQRITQTTGNWEFTVGNSTPNRSQLLLLETEQKISESDQGSNVQVVFTKEPSVGRVYDIVGLSGKDMKLRFETTYNLAFGQEVESVELVLKKS